MQAHYLTPAARQQPTRLFNLLSAHAVHDPGLGYAQGCALTTNLRLYLRLAL